MALWGYFDEAGHTSDKSAHSFVIAGCIAEEEAWSRFNLEWSAILDKESVTDKKGVRWFHWKDFRRAQNAFEGWDWIRSESVFARLRRAIKNHAALVIAAYKGYDTHDRSDIRSEYLAVHEYVIRQGLAAITSVRGDVREPVHFVFAKHPEINPIEHHNALRIHLTEGDAYRETLGDLLLSDPRSKPALQAADLIAGEIYRWLPKSGSRTLPETLRPLTLPFVIRRIQ